MVFLCSGLILILCGAYLIFHGLWELFNLETTDICKAIRPQLRPEEENLTGKELLALVDRDLSYALEYAGGKVLIGQEWPYPKIWGKW